MTRPRPDSGAQARGLNGLTHWCWWSGRAGSGGSEAIAWVGLVSRVPLHRPWCRPPADSPRGQRQVPPRGSNPPRFQLQPHTRSGPSAGTRTGCHQSPRVTDGRLRSLLSPSPLSGTRGSCGPPFPEGLGFGVPWTEVGRWILKWQPGSAHTARGSRRQRAREAFVPGRERVGCPPHRRRTRRHQMVGAEEVLPIPDSRVKA